MSNAIAKAKWFHYHQNNSGGSFHKPAMNVFVQAFSAEQANEIAEQNGLYWNGISEGRDCECCGDRWYSLSPEYDKGDDEPSVYGESIYAKDKSDMSLQLAKSWQESDKVPYGILFYLDGNVEILALK